MNALTCVPDVAALLLERFRAGSKLLIAGNGGSAAIAQHLAAELVVRYQLDRRPLPALALSADGVVLTAGGNDYDFTHVFARQVQALGREGDVLLVLSTSGRSVNVFNAVRAANDVGMVTVGFFGSDPTEMAMAAQVRLFFVGANAGEIQEQHLHALHEMCALVEKEVAGW